MTSSNGTSKGSANNNDGLMTIVPSIQYIGIDASNSKPLTKNNNKAAYFIRKYAQFSLMTWHMSDKLCQTIPLLTAPVR